MVTRSGHTNVTETIIGSPLTSVPEMMVTMSRFLPSFLLSCLSICASCVQNRSAINVGRLSKRITVIVLFITQGIFIVRATAGSG